MVELAATRLSGSPDSEALLVVGPSLGTSVTALWGRCASLLEGLEVLGWDLPGHGRSPAAATPFSVAALAAAVRELATAAASGRETWYAGVSLGGAVGWELALDPGPFAAVAALASAPKIGEPGAWRDRAGLVRRAGTPVMVASSVQRWFAPGFTDRYPDDAGALLMSLSDADAGSYAFACEALAAFDVRDGVTGAKVPVLAAAGEHDAVLPPELVRAAAPTTAFAVVRGCGHLPPAEDPAAVATLLTDFLTTQRADR
ncbi:alpha/beta fold hydrolase [Dactylosporangium sp. NPDC048998]|uniref:alpha/beta fold hydrolase n=1 Tax=Dactylosporangium sp. NPDC048998 TaxID=3363976 RepID=UPI00372055CD